MARFNSKFDSIRNDWPTPQWLFDLLDSEFAFGTDLAASPENTKCPDFFCADDDALSKTWHGTCWLNPPYGTKQSKLSDWVRKAHASTVDDSCTVVMLIPCRTNTKWWHDYVMQADEIRFLCGRPKFGDAIYGLPQSLAIVVFRKHDGGVKVSTLKCPKGA